jgi:hypothetical protein
MVKGKHDHREISSIHFLQIQCIQPQKSDRGEKCIQMICQILVEILSPIMKT